MTSAFIVSRDISYPRDSQNCPPSSAPIPILPSLSNTCDFSGSYLALANNSGLVTSKINPVAASDAHPRLPHFRHRNCLSSDIIRV
jgi:hypothetical protein